MNYTETSIKDKPLKVDFKHQEELEIVKFLYQFKDDNKFYKLDKLSLNVQSEGEKYMLLYTLRDNALIGTDREVYVSNTGEYYADQSYNYEIRAKILPKGVSAIESFLNNR
jgi:hypothetical protein